VGAVPATVGPCGATGVLAPGAAHAKGLRRPLPPVKINGFAQRGRRVS
jgi:hypothetical protein